MATTEETQFRLMRQRARALTILLLTNRPGVEVEDAPDATGIQLLARVRTPGKSGLRQFGINLYCSILGDATVEAVNDVFQVYFNGRDDQGPYPWPVVMFAYSIRNDLRWYAWVTEPRIGDDGVARLPLIPQPEFRPLDDAAVEAIIDRVDQWYDAHYEQLAAAKGKRQKKS